MIYEYQGYRYNTETRTAERIEPKVTTDTLTQNEINRLIRLMTKYYRRVVGNGENG